MNRLSTPPGLPSAAGRPPAPAHSLADGFAHVLRHWAMERGSTSDQAEAVAQAGREVIEALQDGHVCITVPLGARSSLLATGLVATPTQRHRHPLVLDDHQRLYLHRDFEHEHALAHRIAAAMHRTPDAHRDISPAPGMPELSPDQRTAVGLALTHRFCLISGGPGTGKTTTVVSLLYALLQQDATQRIVLAAPTGKAAARLLDSVRGAAHAWPPALQQSLPTRATTLHRLLGLGAMGPGGGASAAPEPGSLEADVLIVDEASMVDLALARHVLQATALTARVVLLGDKDQLSAVETGAVFSELCASAPLLPGVAVLRQAFRFEATSAIGQLASAILQGQHEPVLQLLSASPAGLRWICPPSGDRRPAELPEVCTLWTAGFSAYTQSTARAVQACRDASPDLGHHLGAALHALGRFRVLCAVREGPWGVHAWNRLLHDALASLIDPGASSREQRIGQPIVIRQNDAPLGLFNGDMGVLLPHTHGQVHAFFANTDPDSPGWRAIALAQLPAYEPAWAMTVHLAQGSEFDQVLLVLPAVNGSTHTGLPAWPGLSREWLYTAVTRARQEVVVLSPPEAVQWAVQQHRPRASGLRDQLRQALRGGAPSAPAAAVDPPHGRQ